MIGVYLNHVRFRSWAWTIFDDRKQNVTFYEDLNEYLASDHTFRFAFFSSVAEDTLVPAHTRLNDGARERVRHIQAVSDHTFLIDSELHSYHLHLMDMFRNGRPLTWVLPGRVNDPRFSGLSIMWTPFIERVAGFYQTALNWLLQGLDTKHYPKRLMFDALLGRQRRHRNFVFDRINNSGLSDQFVTSYQGLTRWHEFLETAFVKDSYVMTGTDALEAHGTNHEIKFGRHNIPLYAIIPIETYNSTAYTLVTETQPENIGSSPLVFFTEKIVKPLVALRPFVVFSVPRYLETLQSLGFRTFGDVIDESYDQEQDDQRRWDMAWQQVVSLLHRDQCEVRKQVAKTLRHNQRVAFETDWQNFPVPAIRSIIATHGGEVQQCLRHQ
jgi:hypothetical protein